MKTDKEMHDELVIFLDQLRNNSVKTPNEFTIEMGKLIRLARDEKGWSQAEFASKMKRRIATISDIENGKSDISIITLLAFAVILVKPISYFFPKSLLKDTVMDVKSPFQQQGLELLRRIEFFDGTELTLDILKRLANYFEEQYQTDNEEVISEN